jgi:hypothetical protein
MYKTMKLINEEGGRLHHLQGRKSAEQETSVSRCFLSEHGKTEPGGKKSIGDQV